MSVKNCVVCFHLSNGEKEQDVFQCNWYGFNVCKKHKERANMSMPCPKCGNQDTQFKSGVSAKTGKKWSAWKCEACNLMIGMDGIPWGDKGASPKPQTTYDKSNSQVHHPGPLDVILKEVREIKKILVENFGEGAVAETQETPF